MPTWEIAILPVGGCTGAPFAATDARDTDGDDEHSCVDDDDQPEEAGAGRANHAVLPWHTHNTHPQHTHNM